MINLFHLTGIARSPLEFLDHHSAISSLKFSHDNKTFSSASYDHTVRIWNPDDPKQNPIIISGHDSWVMDLAFTSDGNRLISASNDKTVRLFEVNSDLMSSNICSRVNRNLSLNEWVAFVGKDIRFKELCPKIKTDK